MDALRRIAAWLLEDTDREHHGAIVRRFALANAAVIAFWAALAFWALDRPIVAGLGVVAVAGLAAIAASAARRPVAAAVSVSAWIWVLALANLLLLGGAPATTVGSFLLAIVAAGLLVGVRAALIASALTAIAGGAAAGLGDAGVVHGISAPTSRVSEWWFSLSSVITLPLLLVDSLGRLRGALRRAEDAERRHQLVSDHARDLIWMVEGEAVVYASPACEALFGWTQAEMIARGSQFATFTPDSALAVRAKLEEAFASGVDHVRYEAEHVRKDGAPIWCEVEASLRRGPDGRVRAMSGVTRDVSERRRGEAERARIQGELVQAQKMEVVGRLAAGIAHDINNQLTVIVAGAEALDEPSLRAGVQKDILDAALNAAAMTRQLQAFSRRRSQSLAPCDLNLLVARLERTLARLLGVDVELAIRVLPRPAVARVDASQIEQVLLNLAVNARDAMPAGGRLTLAVEDGASGAVPTWVVRVTDTGSGIDAPTLARIFEPFFTTKPEGRGTGLGLSMVRRIVDEVGGSVHVASEPGHGSTFTVALPKWEGEGSPAREASGAASAAPAGGTVLVVDDSPEVRRLLQDALARSGDRVLRAATPASALEVAAAAPALDLVVTDVVMPGRSGPELVAALRRQRPSLPVLYVSGHVGEDFDVASDPSARFLAKPFSMRALERAVRESLSGRAEGAGDDG